MAGRWCLLVSKYGKLKAVLVISLHTPRSINSGGRTSHLLDAMLFTFLCP